MFDYRRVALTCFMSTPTVDVPNFNLLKGRMKLPHPIPMMFNTHQMDSHNFLDPKGSSFLCMNSDFALYLWSVSLGRTITQMVSTNRNQPVGNQLATHSIAWACHTSFNRIPFLNQQKKNWFQLLLAGECYPDPRWSWDQLATSKIVSNDLPDLSPKMLVLSHSYQRLPKFVGLLDLNFYTHVKNMEQSQMFRRGPWSTPVRQCAYATYVARWLRGIFTNEDEGYHFQKWRYIHIT